MTMKLHQFIKECELEKEVPVLVHIDDLDDGVDEGWEMEHGDPFEGNKTATVALKAFGVCDGRILGIATWGFGNKPTTEFGIEGDKIWFGWGDGERPDED